MASLKATGATIHGLNEAECNYRHSVRIFNDNSNKYTKKDKEKALYRAVDWEFYLRKFVANVAFDKSLKPGIYI